MEIENLRLLSEVARHGSFAVAARKRDLDPSSVSRIVARTEQELGIRIFQRTTRRLSLTEAGNSFMGRIESILDEFERAREDATGRNARPMGTLRITTSVAFGQACIVPLLPEFREAFPQIAVELMMNDENVDLVRERIDLAIRLAPAIEGDLICSKLRETRYRVCASPQYLMRAPELRRPSDLVNHQCLLFALPEFRARWLFRSHAGLLTEVPVKGSIIISNALALKTAALADLGPVLLADWLVDRDVEEGRLIDLFPRYDITATTFETAAWIVYPSRAFLPSKVRATVDFLRKRFGN